jgi:hypothetical protein
MDEIFNERDRRLLKMIEALKDVAKPFEQGSCLTVIAQFRLEAELRGVCKERARIRRLGIEKYRPRKAKT